jgi:hypothetical protein
MFMAKWKPMRTVRQSQQQDLRYKNVAADVSRLKLASRAHLFECSAEKNDPAHAGCYEKPEFHPN